MKKHQPIHMFIEAAAQEDGAICHTSNQSVEQTRNFDDAMLDCTVNCPKKVRALITIAERSLETQGFLDRLEIAYYGKRLTIKRITNPSHARSAVKLLKARASHRKKVNQTI
jgi:hypothetical protein